MTGNHHPKGHVLQAFADGALDAATAAQVAGHCAACDACRRELEQIGEVHAVLARDPGPARPRPAWPAVQARLQRERRPLGLTFAFGTALACAAGLALSILVGGGGVHHQVAGPVIENATEGGASLLDIFATAIPEES